MRKFKAVILLFVLVASLYARHISYLECRLSNYFSINDRTCDCGKIVDTAADSTSNPPGHRHIHFDDSYFEGPLSGPCKKACFLSLNSVHPTTERLCEGVATGLYRPPQS